MRHAATVEPTTDTAQHQSRPKNGVLSFTRMSGSSIAALDAATWVTDFVNAAYYRRSADEREVDDLRLASCVLTTFWYRKPPGQRLRLTDLRAFHRAFGHDRFDTEDSARGTLSRQELLDGAARLLGDWFPAAYADDERRGWGIAFETTQARAHYDPAYRMDLASLGALTPETAPPRPAGLAHLSAGADALGGGRHRSAHGSRDLAGLRQRDRALHAAARRRPRRTDLRDRGRRGDGQGPPIFTRGYVTITKLVTPADPSALGVWFAPLEAGLARFGDNEPHALPDGAQPLVGFDLTTHAGHFMGAGHNRLLLYTHGARRLCAPPAPGTRCRGTSSTPTGSRAATPSMRSGARAMSWRRACCTNSPCERRGAQRRCDLKPSSGAQAATAARTGPGIWSRI